MARNTPRWKKQTNKHPRWEAFAAKLADAIAEVREVNRNSQWRRWAISFYRLHSIDGVAPKRIREVLKWYCTQLREGDLITYNEQMIPIAYAGGSFRKKFLRIEAAMVRIDGKKTKQSVKAKAKRSSMSKEELRKHDQELGW